MSSIQIRDHNFNATLHLDDTLVMALDMLFTDRLADGKGFSLMTIKMNGDEPDGSRQTIWVSPSTHLLFAYREDAADKEKMQEHVDKMLAYLEEDDRVYLFSEAGLTLH